LLAIADGWGRTHTWKPEKSAPNNVPAICNNFPSVLSAHGSKSTNWHTISCAGRGDKTSFYKWRLAQVKDLFTPEDFTSNKPLTGEYLLGYYCQRQKMWEKKDKGATEENDNSNSNE
jgi:CRISPR-associated protein Csd1